MNPTEARRFPHACDDEIEPGMSAELARRICTASFVHPDFPSIP